MSDPGSYATSLKYHNDKVGIAPSEPNHNRTIKQLAHKDIASGSTNQTWAEETEMGLDWTLQGEYYRTPNYSPPPVPPSPTSWYPPPPITDPPTHGVMV